MVTRLKEQLGLGEDAWVRSTYDLELADDSHPGVELLITVGGDGTILRAACVAAPYGIPILGINMGRVGFMTELRAQEALSSVARYLEEGARVEERAMLQAKLLLAVQGKEEKPGLGPFHALNDVVIGGSGASRMVAVEVGIDGSVLTAYRADAVIVATATGSTGYALSAGGPILHPLSDDIVLQPVAAQHGLGNALVLPSGSRVELTLRSDRPATMNVDGFVDKEMGEGSVVSVETSPYRARFLRMPASTDYYATLTRRLGRAP